MLLMILMEKKLLEHLQQRIAKNKSKKKLKLKKQSRKNAVNHMLSERDTIICLIAGYIKNTWYKCFNIFQNQYL